MAEQLAVEVDVKNVMHTVQSSSSTEDKLIYFVWISDLGEKIASYLGKWLSNWQLKLM